MSCPNCNHSPVQANSSCPKCNQVCKTSQTAFKVVEPIPQKAAELQRIRQRNDEKIEQFQAQKPTTRVFEGGKGALGGVSSPPEDPNDIRGHRARLLERNGRVAKMQSQEIVEQQKWVLIWYHRHHFVFVPVTPALSQH
jgi:hypothetical protein